MNFPFVSKIKNKIRIPEDFENVRESKLFNSLHTIEPFGSTSLWDAVSTAVQKVKNVSAKQNSDVRGINYSFKIIVVTDGEDTSSTTTASEVSRLLSSVAETTEVNDCNLLFLTVDLERHEQANLELIGITSNSSSHCKLMQIQSRDIESTFEREIFTYEVKKDESVTQIEDGKQITVKSTKILSVEIQQEKRFAVLFVLDISLSMRDQRWDDLIKGVRGLKSRLEKNPENLVDVILFNGSVIHYTHPHFGKKFVKGWGDGLSNATPWLCCLCLPMCAPCCLSEIAYNNAHGTNFTFSSCFQVVLCGPIGLALNRRAVRKAYNIDGNCFIDCCLFSFGCCLCMTSQEWAESRYRGEGLKYA